MRAFFARKRSARCLENGHFRGISKPERVEPLAWPTDVLERMVSGRKAYEVEQLLPWTWKAERLSATVDA
jgi:hypothetical protein